MRDKPISDAGELLQLHRDLMKHLKSLQSAVFGASTGYLPRILKELATVQKEVNEHFQSEEEGGYLKVVLERGPHLEQAVDDLKAQHIQLRQGLDTLISECRNAGGISREWTERIQDWMNQLRDHESHENKLVQEAFSLEIGGGD